MDSEQQQWDGLKRRYEVAMDRVIQALDLLSRTEAKFGTEWLKQLEYPELARTPAQFRERLRLVQLHDGAHEAVRAAFEDVDALREEIKRFAVTTPIEDLVRTKDREPAG